MLEEEKIETIQKLDVFEKTLKNEREDWKTKIISCSSKFKDISKITDLQVEIFSSMARLSDRRRELSMIYSKRMNKVREKKGILVDDVIKNPVRLTAKEKEFMVESKLKDEYLILEFLEGHIEFIHDTYSTFDKMGYAVKDRLKVEEYTNI